MKYRNAWMLFVLLVVVACGGPAEEPAEPGATEPAPEAPMDDAAALDERTEYFVTHYNMHHADMVAELYTEDAVFLAADGSVHEGRDAIRAAMEEDMAAEPTVSIDVADRIISGEYAVSRGTWGLEMTPEGATAPVSVDGSFMFAQEKLEGEWQTMVVLTNYDQEPPAEMPPGEAPAELPADMAAADNPLAELAEYYETHYNMGHADMVASRYAEDAVVMPANEATVTGRDAIAAEMNTAMTEMGNPQIDIHTVDAEEIGDGWVTGGGWYEITAANGNVRGNWMLLARPGDDGNLQIQWVITNGQPVAMQ